jgi:hypothetical protein
MSPSSDHSTAGASARREHERRRARREAKVRARHPRLGGLLLALGEAPADERRWARGARGEEMVAEALDARCRPEVAVLHDRRIPGSRANIDHIAVGPGGVWVIDAKRYAGRIRVERPLFGQPKLMVGRRDRTKLVDGLAKQVALVAPLAESAVPDVSVRGALCFVEGELPLIGTPTIGGFPLLERRRLAKRLNADGPLALDAIAAVTEALARRFPPA